MTFLNNRSLRVKLMIGTISLLICVVALSATSFFSERKMLQEVKDFFDFEFQSIAFVLNADRDLQQLLVAERTLLNIRPDDKLFPKMIDDYAENYKQFSERLEKHRKLFTVPEQTAMYDQYLERKKVWDADSEALLRLLKSEAASDRAQAIELSLGKKLETFEAMRDTIDKLGELTEVQAQRRFEHSQGLYLRNAVLMGALSLISFVSAIVSILFFSSIGHLISTAASKIAAQTDEVKVSVESIAAGATSLSSATTQQAASTQQTAAAIDEINAMVLSNSKSAQQSTSNLDDAITAASAGDRKVAEMVSAIEDIAASNNRITSEMEDNRSNFADIVKLIAEIGDKTKVINDIVFQTKLLSFNASVEAARAGEHGKGFAVVAEEVGSLAQMSGNAAKEISDLITSSTQRVHSIVEKTSVNVQNLVTEAGNRMERGRSLAGECHDALQRIRSCMESVSTRVAEISAASQQQAIGINEVEQAVVQLDQVTQQNAALAQKSSEAAEILNLKADELEAIKEHLVRLVKGRAA